MTNPDNTLDHVRKLIERITESDDGAHVPELLQLVHAVADPNNIVAIETEKHLYSMTPEFQSHFKKYMEGLKVA
jgi:hypothetical protein